MDNYVPNDYGPPEIEPEDIEYYEDELLGSGSYGNVYAGKCRAKDVAVKVLNNQKFSESDIETFKKEINVMSKIHHPNIVLYMGACTVDGELKIVTEKMETDLSTLLHSEKQLTLIQKMRIAKDCALGMAWLHGSQNPIIHHDLKPSNCLIDENMRVKISDFGFSIIKPKGEFICSEVPKGTAIYMAPEISDGDEYDEKCDVYSFGIILWEIYTRTKPYNDIPDLSTDTLFYHVNDNGRRPIVPEECPDKIRSLITRCWDADPDARPPFADIIDKIQEIIIEEAILDPTGRSFWKRSFSSKDKIPWMQFIKDFSKLMEVQNDLLCACLKEILITRLNNEESVALDQFGKMLEYFGPIRRGGLKTQFFNNLKNIFSQPWFHGPLNTDETGSILHKASPGTFLVRFSSSEKGYFTISHSVEDVGKLRNIRIKHPPLRDEFSVGVTVHTSLIDLIEKESESLKLKEPCPGSKFAYILSQTLSEYL
jgi:serine/threonine protein kinase